MSLASVAASLPPDAMSVTIRATSMIVTAAASTSDPNGSPTRCATTSAWWTAASTAPIEQYRLERDRDRPEVPGPTSLPA